MIHHYYEYGRQIDCVATGCDPLHSDHEYILPWPTETRGIPDITQETKVNKHVTHWVQRLIVVGDWFLATTNQEDVS